MGGMAPTSRPTYGGVAGEHRRAGLSRPAGPARELSEEDLADRRRAGSEIVPSGVR